MRHEKVFFYTPKLFFGKKIEMVSATFSGVTKHVSNVQKVIRKMRQNTLVFQDVQEDRIAKCLEAKRLGRPYQNHPKMRIADINEIESLCDI